MSINETIYETTMMDSYVDEEEHIVVDENRKITVPENLKTIAVQGDKDIETVTIDCVRYWDGNDLSTFRIYINCELPNGDEVTYIPDEITVKDTYFSFYWVIGREITPYDGKLKFWIVAKIIDDKGNDVQQWSSLQNDDCIIARGGGEIYVPSLEQEKDEFLKNINQVRIVEEDGEDNNGITNTDEAHIVVEKNREIIVPNNLKVIAVKGDKNVETVTVDCIRYWDGKDLSEFVIYVNYKLPNGEDGTYIPEEITVKESIFSFSWLIGRHITSYVGSLTFWIVAKETDDDGNLLHQWSSLQNKECSIAQGGDKIQVPEEEDKDIINQAISLSKKYAERAEAAADRAVQIESINKISSIGVVDTYEIVMKDDKKQKFEVTNGTNGYTPVKNKDYFDGYTPQKNVDYFDGVGIKEISKTLTVGLVDTYTITMTDGSTFDFTVTNGSSGGSDTEEVYEYMTANLSVNPSSAEYADVVTNVKIAWDVSKEAEYIKLTLPKKDSDGNPVVVDLTNKESPHIDTSEYLVTSSLTWKLDTKRKDGKQETVPTKKDSIDYYYLVYWGAGNKENYNDPKFMNEFNEVYDVSFLSNLLPVKTTVKGMTLKFTSIESQYIYYAIPENLCKNSDGTISEPIFQIGEFPYPGGVKKVKELTIKKNGISIVYYLYRTYNLLVDDDALNVYVK